MRHAADEFIQVVEVGGLDNNENERGVARGAFVMEGGLPGGSLAVIDELATQFSEGEQRLGMDADADAAGLKGANERIRGWPPRIVQDHAPRRSEGGRAGMGI